MKSHTFTNDFHYILISSSWLKKSFILKSMIALNIIIIIFLSLLTLDSDSYPIVINWNSDTVIRVTPESTKEQRIRLLNLVNSQENKLLFNEIQYGEDAFYDIDENVVGVAKFPIYNQYQRQPYISNGYIGSRIPNLGQGFTYDQSLPTGSEDDLTNGWPLFNKRFSGAYIAGFYNIQEKVNKTNFPELYDNGYESIIATIPQWTGLTVSLNKDGKLYTLDPSLSHQLQGPITNYAQNLSLSHGTVTTEFTWFDFIQLKFEVIAHKSDINLGVVNLEITNIGKSAIKLNIEDKLDFDTTQRSQLVRSGYDRDGIFQLFQPSNVDYVFGAIYSKLVMNTDIIRHKLGSSVSQSSIVQIEPSSSITATKFVGILSSDLNSEKFSDRRKVLNFVKKVAMKYKDINSIFNSHKLAWHKSLDTSSAVKFIENPLLTLVSRASLYHLLANTRSNAEGVTAALSVGGLSSDSYGGMVFWDTDLWALNGILPFLPSNAASLINYRTYTHEQAIKNVQYAYDGAAYPWTSGRFGNCTSTGPCLNYEYHINVAIAMAAWNMYLSGAVDDVFLSEVAYPLINDAALFMSEIVKFNSSLGEYFTHNMTDPDEYANHIDNGAYTNSGISLLMKWSIAVSNHLSKPMKNAFDKIAGKLHIPVSSSNFGFDDKITLEYSGMNSSVEIKQADVIMISYPLENELIDKAQAYRNMQFYSGKQDSHGPAMTFPIFSIVSANLSPSGCSSQSYFQKSITPYLRGPFAQFSEQNNDDYSTNGGTHPAFPFITAHGGFMQAVLQGLIGIRYDHEIIDKKICRYLTVDPISISCLAKGLVIEDFKYMNRSLSFIINESLLTIKNKGPINNYIYEPINLQVRERNAKSGRYILEDFTEISLPLFTPSKSFTNSLSECNLANFIGISKGVPGDVTSSINDGDNSTHWQAKSKDSTAKILVDLKTDKIISNGHFNWGERPPRNVKLYKWNEKINLKDEYDFLSKVDFGHDMFGESQFDDSEVLFSQDEVFELIVYEEVSISEPYNASSFEKIEIPKKYNTSSFDLNNENYTRFMLIEFNGIHDQEDETTLVKGAKLFEASFS